MMNEHPLSLLLSQYTAEYNDLRAEGVDLDNIRFHNTYGLAVSAPFSWPIHSSIIGVIIDERKKMTKWHNTIRYVIIYPSTSVYATLSKEMEDQFGDAEFDDVGFFAWHEFYVAMNRINEDVRYFNHFRTILQQAQYVFFLGSSTAMKEVVDHVKNYTDGCLIMFGGEE